MKHKEFERKTKKMKLGFKGYLRVNLNKGFSNYMIDWKKAIGQSNQFYQ